MVIKKLQIQNFEGFDETFEYEFTEPFNALCLRNGAGKTSFLNALRYAITGIKPAGNVINNTSSQMAVGLTFHDGTGIIRQDFADNKSARYFLNRRPVTKKALDDMLQSRAGVAQGTMKIATSTDVLAGLKPQEFGDLLLSYIPESLDIDKILDMLGHLTKEEETEIREFFPDGSFGMDMIDAFYKHLSEKRKTLNKKLQECESYLNHFVNVPATDKTEDEIQKEIDELTKQQGSVNLYNEQKRNYENALNRKKKHDTDVDSLKKEISKFDNIKIDEKTVSDSKKRLPELQEKQEEYRKELAFINQTVDTLAKALEDLNKPVCPLSDKLKCTTDKSAVRTEIEDTLKVGREKQVEYARKVADVTKNIADNRKIIDDYAKISAALERKKTLEEQLNKLLKEEIVVPAEPKPVSAEDCSQRIKVLANTLSAVKSAADIKRVKGFVDAKRPLVEAYNNLIKIFAPKGVIKQKVSEYYLEAFEEQCNKKASQLLPNMSLKFVSNAGISVLTDINGDGNYVSFEGLSGGERSYVLFILLDMINSLTGLRMMFLDELSVLDKNAFETLVKLIKDNLDEYDLVILATAEHDDNMQILKDNNVNMIEF